MMSRFHVLHHGLPVHLPLPGQGAGLGVLAATQFHGDFKAVGVDVVKVLHSTGNIVPSSSIGDALRKGVSTGLALGHHRMIASVEQCHMFEEVIIRS